MTIRLLPLKTFSPPPLPASSSWKWGTYSRAAPCNRTASKMKWRLLRSSSPTTHAASHVMQKGCTVVWRICDLHHIPHASSTMHLTHGEPHRGTYIGHSSSTTPYSCQGNLAITAKVAGGKAQGPAIRGNSGVDQVEVCLKLFGTCKANRWEWTYILEYNLLKYIMHTLYADTK